MQKEAYVSVTDNVTLVTIPNIPCDTEFFEYVFENIAEFGINIDMISITPPQSSIVNLSFTIDDEDLCKLLKFNAMLSDKHLKPVVSSNNRKIKIYDELMKDMPGVAAKVFKAVRNTGIDIRIVTTSEVEITFLVTEACSDKAVNAIKEAIL